jgi:cyclic pyranopterin phosphate synthase
VSDVPKEPGSATGLTHVDASGNARMVDIGDKDVTERLARARGLVRMLPATLERVLRSDTPKGDVLGVARIAGIQGAKRTSDLIPLCHPIALTSVRVTLEPEGDDAVVIEATAKCIGRTGVEMEALTAVSVAALALYDMLKAIDRAIAIENIVLVEKRGGKSGDYVR